MKKYIIGGCLLVVCCVLFFHIRKIEKEKSTPNYIDWVDPMIGTGGHGHTFPGATLPFGMVQLSPDTGIEGWDWCSGYHYTDSSIIGFSHTHLSGTGRGDLLDLLIMPVCGDLKLDPGSKQNPDAGYRSRFSHERESATPGYYKVTLDDYDIDVELSATTRCGIHRYTFNKREDARIIIDLSHGLTSDSIINTTVRLQGESTLVGSRKTKGWGEPGERYWALQDIYFAIRLSEQPENIRLFSNQIEQKEKNAVTSKDLQAIVEYGTKDPFQLIVKVGISPVSIENAIENLDKEIPDWNFDNIVQTAQKNWNKELSKIAVDADTITKKAFYTALYHSMIAPYTFNDVNGQYKGFNNHIAQADTFTNYTVFSLWDTFRATHPLFTIIQADKVNDMIKSMIAQYDQYGLLPVWPLWASETNCMIGYHSAPVIVDAYFKGIRNFDVEKAYKALKHSAMQDEFGINYLKQYGYIPYDKYNKSVSTALEYCFDDWCLARLAKALGYEDDYNYFLERSYSYHLYFDPEYKLMNGLSSSKKHRRPFDPFYSSYKECDWVEGNSWQYSFFVPHDPKGLIKLYGNEDAFSAQLDSLFIMPQHITGEDVPLDITGFIGQYVHGNEPSHHVAYLYNYTKEPWKGQLKLREIMQKFYGTTPDGLCGNEDCGQMSAWYVFSALGFYPVNPASGIYLLGSPMVENATLYCNGNKFQIVVENQAENYPYVRAVFLNGQHYTKKYITHSDIERGGELRFVMGSTPDKESIYVEEDLPPTTIEELNKYNKK